jgi:hypothetical protein
MKIHLNSRQGVYTVEQYGRDSITCSTKHTTFQVPVDDFKSFAGGLWNFNVSKEEMDTFLSIVQPEKYKKQFELENEIISIAKRIDMIDKFKALSIETVVVEEEPEAYEDDYPDSNPQEPTKEEYEKWWRQESDKNYELNNKMRNIARQVYSQNLDFTHFQNHKGIKFIIQQDHYDDKINRFCWDPYGFVSNGHSDISSIYSEGDWGTINGGWIKIIDDNVILYAKSGDYGVYDDAIAIDCAKKIFPTKKIHSFAGRQWDDELTSKFSLYPF